MESSGYNFNGLDIHGAILVNEQVRKKISLTSGESKEDKSAKAALTLLSDALTEYVYQETLKMEKDAKKI
jgi:hypothetical protein